MIVCSNEEEEKSYLISKLHVFRRPFVPANDLQDYKKYLAIHFTHRAQEHENEFSSQDIAASSVDPEQYVY